MPLLIPPTTPPLTTPQSDDSFVLYFAATTTADSTGSTHCIGYATATTILGPYTPASTSLICPLSAGGAIDPAGFRDNDGQRYIVYKVDGNSIGSATPLVLQPVAADGVTLQGTATTLLENQGASDDNIIEAPSLLRTADGVYVLFFSPGDFTTSVYSVSYATANAVTGPYTRAATPLFATGDDGLTAPGGADVWSDGTHLVFHADNGSGVRSLWTAEITVSGDSVSA